MKARCSASPRTLTNGFWGFCGDAEVDVCGANVQNCYSVNRSFDIVSVQLQYFSFPQTSTFTDGRGENRTLSQERNRACGFRGPKKGESMVILEYEYEVFPDGGRFVAASFEFGVVAIGES